MKNQYESGALSCTQYHTHTCKLVGNIDFICKNTQWDRDNRQLHKLESTVLSLFKNIYIYTHIMHLSCSF